MKVEYADVAVAGGGVGGLTAALLLARAGAAVTVLERVARPAAVGAGILLQPNGLAVLSGLGLASDLQATAHRMPGGAVADESGRRISTMSVPDYGHGLDHVLAVRRSRLLEALVDAVTAHHRIDLCLGAEVTAAHPSGTVEYRLQGALHELTADVVVGADGVGSVARSGGDFGVRRRPTRTTYLRGLVDGETGLEGECWTRLGLFGGAPLGDGSTYFYAAADSDPIAAAVGAGDLRALRERWAAVLPSSAATLDRVRSFDDVLVNEVERVDCERWVDNRLVLIGDAAHAMAPTLGQGANSALVDTAVLAAELSADPEEPRSTALARYAARRQAKVRRVQDQADRLAAMSAISHPGLRLARNALLRAAGRIPRLSSRLVATAQQEDPAGLHAAVGRLARSN